MRATSKKLEALALVLVAASFGFAQNTPVSCPANVDLEIQPEFEDALDPCCYQEDGRHCAVLDFCFGIMLSHPTTSHPTCCTNYPSCNAMRDTRSSTLPTLKALSITDVVFSFVILFLVLCHMITTDEDAKACFTLLIIVLEVVDLILCAVSLAILYNSQVIKFTSDLVDSRCFNGVGDERAIGELISELENFGITTIVELAVGPILLFLHTISLCAPPPAAQQQQQQRPQQCNRTSIVCSAFVGDMVECIMAVIGLAAFLIPAIQGFQNLYDTIGTIDATGPCLRTCCFIEALHPSFPLAGQQPLLPSTGPHSTGEPMSPSYEPTQQPTPEPTGRPTPSPITFEPTMTPTQSTLEAVLQDFPVAVFSDLDLSNRRLVGTIPTAIGSFTRLTSLDLFGNWFTGMIPTEIGQLSRLTYLRLGRGNKWIGGIPTELGRLTLLEHLDVFDTELTGTIPTQIGLLTALTLLNLRRRNQLRGTIPTQLGLLVKLTTLLLDENDLSGTVPRQLGFLTDLTDLWLSEIRLSGTIPSSICDLRSLTRLSFGCSSLECPCGNPPCSRGSFCAP